MRVLITRPKADSERLARILCELGHHPIVSPLREIRFHEGRTVDLTDVQAILATSANGVRALARATSRRNMSIFAVGPQTASEAGALGFETVENASGDADRLAEFVAARSNPQSGILLHVAGKHHNAALTARLQSWGFQTRTATLYETVENPALTNEAQDELRAKGIDAVMLFSPRSASLFVEAIGRGTLRNEVHNLAAVCISNAAAGPLSPLPLRTVAIARSPNQEYMIDLLGQI